VLALICSADSAPTLSSILGRSRRLGDEGSEVLLRALLRDFPLGGKPFRDLHAHPQEVPNLVYFYFNKVDKGGHFSAREESELFTTDMRAAFRSLY
jgi:hypothetical protein